MLLSITSLFFLFQMPGLEPGTTKIEFTRKDEILTPSGLSIPSNLPPTSEESQNLKVTMAQTGWSLRHQTHFGRKETDEDKFRVKTFQVKVPEDGSWTIRMKGSFDGALILLDENGNWIRADDDGWFWLNPSLTGVDLKTAETYQLKAIVNGGGVGLAELTLNQGGLIEHEQEVLSLLEREYPLGDYVIEEGKFLETVKSLIPPHALRVETVTGPVIALLDGSQPKPLEQWYRRRLAERDLPTRLDGLKIFSDSDDLAIARTIELTAKFLALRLTEPRDGQGNRLVDFQYSGAFREIRTLFRLALNIKSNRYGPDNPAKILAYLRSSASPATLLGLIGDRYGVAEFLGLDVKIAAEFNDPSSPMVLGALIPLGVTQMEMGDFVSARANLTRAYRGMERMGPVLETLRQTAGFFLARLAFAEEREAEGISLLRKARASIENLFVGIGHDVSNPKQLFDLLGGWETLLPFSNIVASPDPKELFGPLASSRDNIALATMFASASILDLAMQLSKAGDHLKAIEYFGEAFALSYIRVDSPRSIYKKVFSKMKFIDRRLFFPDEVFLQVAYSAEALGMDRLEARAIKWGIDKRFSPSLEEDAARPGWRKTDELQWRWFSFPLKKEKVAMSIQSAELARRGQESSPQRFFAIWKEGLESFHGELEERVKSEDLHPAHPRLKKVREVLAEVCRRSDQPKEAEKWQQLAEGQTVSMLPPKLQLWSPSEERPTLGERTFLLQGLLEDPSGQPDLRYRLDGGTWVSARDLEVLWEPSEEGKPWRFSVPLSVPRGRTSARFDIQATSSSGEKSEMRVLHPTYQPRERRLFVFAFGVADYDDDALDLAYPTKDVDDIIAAFSAQEGAAFDKVLVKSLKNEEVSSASIRKALKSFLRDAAEDDTIIVFGAGHGVRDEDGEYFFLTSGATFDDPYEGVSRQDIEKLVTWSRLLPARRVLLLDTCQSGRGEADAEGSRGGRSLFMGQSKVDDLALSQAGGLYIIAASSDAGSALESGGNGLFTAGILSALRGEGDANADGKVSIEEVRRFVADFVREATDGAQNPTFPLVEGGGDFVLAVPK